MSDWGSWQCSSIHPIGQFHCNGTACDRSSGVMPWSSFLNGQPRRAATAKVLSLSYLSSAPPTVPRVLPMPVEFCLNRENDIEFPWARRTMGIVETSMHALQ